MPEPTTTVVATTTRKRALRRLVHGLRSPQVPIPRVESRAEWTSFHNHVLKAIHPQGAVEYALASRIAELLWRLRRVAPAERRYLEHEVKIDKGFYQTEDDGGDPDDEGMSSTFKALECGDRSLPHADDDAIAWTAESVKQGPPLIASEYHVERVIRYEAHLNRQLQTTLTSLEVLQRRRAGDHAPLARIAVQTDGG